MIDPHKPKYFNLYWRMAYAAAEESTATRARVGALVVTPAGMLSVGWNGMPAGFDNECECVPQRSTFDPEYGQLKTKPEVIHAERNALDKMHRQGVPTQGSLVFVTLAPCLECAKSLLGLGLKAIHYADDYRDASGIALLQQGGITVHKRT